MDDPITDWMVRLKSALDAGYYRTEEAKEDQERFPWQGRSCSSCPFFEKGYVSTSCRCRVHNQTRRPTDHTCIYFDESNHQTGLEIVNERHRTCGLPPFALPESDKEPECT